MRARNIKPGFIDNEILAECDPLARLLFAHLWMYADREGRFEYRPIRIKAKCLPYDQVDIEGLIAQLEERDFVRRYEVDGVLYMYIPEFVRHQNPHKNEAESRIPEPPCHKPDLDACQNNSSNSTVHVPETSDTSTQHAPETHSTNPADSGFSDSLIQEPSNDGEREQVAPSEKPEVIGDTPFGLYVALCEEIETDQSSVSPKFKSKNLGHAKKLLEDGFGEDKVRRCIRYLRSQHWRTSPFDLGTVLTEIPKWEAWGMPARASPGTRKGADVDWNEFTSELKEVNQR